MQKYHFAPRALAIDMTDRTAWLSLDRVPEKPPPRALTVLAHEGISFVHELINSPRSRLLKIPGIGPKFMKDIDACRARFVCDLPQHQLDAVDALFIPEQARLRRSRARDREFFSAHRPDEARWTTIKPAPGTWCWVTDGVKVWPALYSPQAAGGWSNEDTWEDFEERVVMWIPLVAPERPEKCTPTER